MNPTLLDHVFVLLVLVIVFPLGGWWAYRRFLERLAREGETALVREYRITILWLPAPGAAPNTPSAPGRRDNRHLALRGAHPGRTWIDSAARGSRQLHDRRHRGRCLCRAADTAGH